MTKHSGTFKVESAYGQPINKSFEFEFEQYENFAEAVTDGWSESKLLELVNTQTKANARANAYQAAVAPYKPDPNTPSAIRERMVKDLMKLGNSEETARKIVEQLTAVPV